MSRQARPLSDFAGRFQQRTTDNVQRTPRTRGFSFAEVMFAVVILGIGFILVAAIFPVAIQQSQATNEESTAAAIARMAANSIAALPSTVVNPNVPAAGMPVATPSQTVQSFPLFPPTVKPYVLGTVNTAPTPTTPGQASVPPPAIVVPFTGGRYEAIKGNAILASDPRFAWTAFYSRENNSSSINLTVIAMANRQRPIYDPVYDTVTNVAAAQAVTQRQFAVPTGTIYPTYVCPDRITFTGGPTVSEGWAIGTTTTAQSAQASGQPAGRYYKVGRNLNGTVFEMDPGGDMSLTAGTGGLWGQSGGIADAQIVGTSVSVYPPTTLQATVAYAQLRADPNSPGGRIFLYAGPAQSGGPPLNATTGSFVIVADDFPGDPGNPYNTAGGNGYVLPTNLIAPVSMPGAAAQTPASYTLGALNGRVFRLGKAITEDFEQPVTINGKIVPQPYPPGTFDIDPQYGMRPPSNAYGASPYSPDTFPNPYLLQYNATNSALQSLCCKVYIVGMGKDGTGAYGKEAQDIGVYSTIIPVQ